MDSNNTNITSNDQLTLIAMDLKKEKIDGMKDSILDSIVVKMEVSPSKSNIIAPAAENYISSGTVNNQPIVKIETPIDLNSTYQKNENNCNNNDNNVQKDSIKKENYLIKNIHNEDDNNYDDRRDDVDVDEDEDEDDYYDYEDNNSAYSLFSSYNDDGIIRPTTKRTSSLPVLPRTHPTSAKYHPSLPTQRSPTTGEFSCPSCSLTFSRRYNLQTHFTAHHLKLKPYVCICGRGFSRRYDLGRHKAVRGCSGTKRDGINMADLENGLYDEQSITSSPSDTESITSIHSATVTGSSKSSAINMKRRAMSMSGSSHEYSHSHSLHQIHPNELRRTISNTDFNSYSNQNYHRENNGVSRTRMSRSYSTSMNNYESETINDINKNSFKKTVSNKRRRESAPPKSQYSSSSSSSSSSNNNSGNESSNGKNKKKKLHIDTSIEKKNNLKGSSSYNKSLNSNNSLKHFVVEENDENNNNMDKKNLKFNSISSYETNYYYDTYRNIYESSENNLSTGTSLTPHVHPPIEYGYIKDTSINKNNDYYHPSKSIEKSIVSYEETIPCKGYYRYGNKEDNNENLEINEKLSKIKTSINCNSLQSLSALSSSNLLASTSTINNDDNQLLHEQTVPMIKSQKNNKKNKSQNVNKKNKRNVDTNKNNQNIIEEFKKDKQNKNEEADDEDEEVDDIGEALVLSRFLMKVRENNQERAAISKASGYDISNNLLTPVSSNNNTANSSMNPSISTTPIQESSLSPSSSVSSSLNTIIPRKRRSFVITNEAEREEVRRKISEISAQQVAAAANNSIISNSSPLKRANNKKEETPRKLQQRIIA